MEIQPFALERFFARHEHDADVMLAESGIRPPPAAAFDTDPDSLGYVVPTEGDPDLRATIAARYDRPAAEVVCTTGAQEANFTAFAALVDDHAVCVTPTYQSLHAVPDAFGEVTRVGLDSAGWTLDVEAVKEAVRPGTDVVVLNNPNNPTGRYHDRETVAALYEIAADADAYLLCDEVYRLLAEEPLPPVAAMGEYGVSTSSVSKAHGLAGCRFGWLAGPPAVVDAATRWTDYTTISPSAFGQHLARHALEREATLLAEHRALAADHRAIVASFLEEWGLRWSDPDCGVNALVEVPDGFDGGEQFCRSLVEAESVVLAPGEAFGVPDRFRIGYGLPPAELAEGLERLGRFIERNG
jgi:aspartate/methionine/tyrosine aminotransferase